MKKTSKILAMIIAIISIVISFSFYGCKSSNDKDKNIVCTIFPEYDWVREIVGDIDGYKVTLLLDNGVDLHSYQPSVEDVATISNADMFIYVGGESDKWVQSALKNTIKKDMVSLNLLEILKDKVKEEEQVEGMQGEESETEQAEYDEHVWLSLQNAKIICREIADKLKTIDGENQERIEQNVNSYIERLSNLDGEYKEAVENKVYDTILFGDRFPFRYLVDDYNLKYYGAFTGCSAETEASFETIIFLANKVNELNLPVIMVLEGSNQKLANSIKNATTNKNQEIVSINSLQSIVKSDVENGITYIKVMENNLGSLKKALGE